MRKYHGIAEDSSAAHYFKNSKEVLDLMQRESDYTRRAEIRETMKNQMREISKRSSAPVVANFETAQAAVAASRAMDKAMTMDDGEQGMADDPYQISLGQADAPSRKMTFIGGDTKSKDIVPERPVFETLDAVKKMSNQSALMRPTLNSQGSFVNRSICGSPNGLEFMLQKKDTFKQDFNKLKQMLIKTQ